MGEWSDYFEDFPEENPANWVNGVFDPALAKQIRLNQEAQKKANAEVLALIEAATKKQKEKQEKLKLTSLTVVRSCPQCGLDELNMYCFAEEVFRCECQDCGIYGSGKSEEDAYQAAEDAIGEGIDWRDL